MYLLLGNVGSDTPVPVTHQRITRAAASMKGVHRYTSSTTSVMSGSSSSSKKRKSGNTAIPNICTINSNNTTDMPNNSVINGSINSSINRNRTDKDINTGCTSNSTHSKVVKCATTPTQPRHPVYPEAIADFLTITPQAASAARASARSRVAAELPLSAEIAITPRPGGAAGAVVVVIVDWWLCQIKKGVRLEGILEVRV